MSSALARELERLEARLLDPEVRASATELDGLLTDDFVEHGSSGQTFDKPAIIAALARDPSCTSAIRDFRVTALGPDAALATYRLEAGARVSNRSSVWIRQAGAWRLRFHQGTRSASADDGAIKLYSELASWWPLLSAPEDYEEEARFYRDLLVGASERAPRTLLELGSGGGNNASHLKAHLELTLVEPSAGMLEHSLELNPECEHIRGDMREVRLGRQFDLVFVHDAVVYMLTETDLKRAVETAFIHCAPGGAALFAPDHTRDNFRTSTDCGGHDRGERGLRYLEWTRDADPDGTRYPVDYVYLLHHADGSMRVEHDRHVEGLFSEATWLRVLADAGFEASKHELEHSEVEPGTCDVFIGKRAKLSEEGPS